MLFADVLSQVSTGTIDASGKEIYFINNFYGAQKLFNYLDIKNTKVDFYVLKGIVEELLDFLGFNGRYNFTLGELPKELHPGQSALVNVQGSILGIIGKLHPNLTKKDIYVFEIDLDKLLKNHPTRMTYKDIFKYPSIIKDVSFAVDKKVYSEEIERVIKKAGGKLLTNIKVFDVYEGENVLENEKSIAYSLTFNHPDKTLTDEEVTNIFNKIILDVTTKCNATLRDN